MFSYIWPMVLVVSFNVVYQFCAKQVPHDLNIFAALTITYLVGAAVSLVLFLFMNDGHSLIQEYHKLNWAPIVLGVIVGGLEVGMICLYKAGWPVSIAATVQGAFLAVALIFAGALVYHEPITLNKLLGIGFCVAGLFFINR